MLSGPMALERPFLMLHRLSVLTSSLRFRLLLLIVAAMIPLLALILANANEQRMSIVDTVQADSLRFTRLVAVQHNNYVDFTHEILYTLAQLPSVQTQDLDACNLLLVDLLKHYPLFSNLWTVDAQGNSQCSALPAAAGSINVTTSSWFMQAMTRKEFTVGNYSIGRLTKVPVIVLVMPIIDASGNATGLVGASLSLHWLKDFVTRTELPEGATLNILDSSGVILAKQPDDLASFPSSFPVGNSLEDSSIFQQIERQKEGELRGAGPSGTPRLFGFTHVGDALSGIYVVVSVRESVAFARVNDFLLRSLAILAFVTILALVIGWFGSNLLLLQPIARLIELAKRLGSGTLSTRAAPLGISELDKLGSSMNDMASLLELRQTELTKSNQQLELSYQILVKEVQERRQAERENELKTQFLGMVSHELRTPLASIKGFVSTLLSDDLTWDAEAQRSFLTIVDEETDKLTELVTQLLDLAQIQAGTLKIQREPQTLDQVIDRASAQLAILTSVHTLTIDIPDDLPMLNLDGARIAQVIINLVGNAARYAPPHTTIRVQARKLPDAVEVTVSDEGPGVPAEHREEIFEAFRQLGRREDSQHKGAGLGLAICKGIVESHGGRIWVADTLSGTTITFTLPLTSAQPTTEPLL